MILHLALAYLAGVLTAGITLCCAMFLLGWWMTREAEFEADFGSLTTNDP